MEEALGEGKGGGRREEKREGRRKEKREGRRKEKREGRRKRGRNSVYNQKIESLNIGVREREIPPFIQLIDARKHTSPRGTDSQ